MDDLAITNTNQAIAGLTGATVAIDDARTLLPKLGGLYAWWIVGPALTGVPASAHPVEDGVGLLYVGIAPNGPGSKATLRSRVVGNHLDGNIATSTFRRTLAAFLDSPLQLAPIKRGTKVVLSEVHNAKLSEWQRTHLRLTWYATTAPWVVEGRVIAALQPPLNLDKNEQHPFHPKVSGARSLFRQRAR